MTTDELDSIGEQQEQVEAAAGAVHYWRGKRLAWTYRHSTAFERLQVFGRGVTSNLEAAVTIVYLGLQDDAGLDRVDDARDKDSIKKLRREIAKWADGEGLTMNNADGIECSRVADEIWIETQRSRFEPVIEGQKKSTVSAQPQVIEPTTSPLSPQSSTDQ